MEAEKIAFVVLTIGLVISATLFVIGFVLHVITRYDISQTILRSAVIVLVITPPITIIATLGVFIKEKEKYNAIVTLIVLMMMILSMALGIIFRVKVK